MAYIDLTRITDRHAKDIIDRDSDITDDALWNAEKDTKALARWHQVKSGDIPLEDGSGDLPEGALTSEPLYNYCEKSFLFHLFEGASGVVGLEDVYSDKADKAERAISRAQGMVKRETIMSLDNEVVDRKGRHSGIDIL
jgi:hypothetical protein